MFKQSYLKKFIEHFVTKFLLKIQNYFEAFNCETNGSHERFNFCMRKMIERMSKILSVMYSVLERINRKTMYQLFINSHILLMETKVRYII